MTTDAGTPRTDALRKRVHSRYGDQRTPHFPRESYCVDYDEAVRSLTAAEAERDALRARVAGLEAGLREALEAGAKLLGEKDALRARVKSLEKGLHFYANTRAYLEQLGSKDDPDDCSVPIEEDGGRIARALLAPSSEETK